MGFMPTSTSRRAQHYEELLYRLEGEVIKLRHSPDWLRYLQCQARFHRYSPRNVLLIAMQRPEATFVAGYRTWESLDRHVRRGEKGISILAPLIQRQDGADDTLKGFRWVRVFDISQTEGAPLPSPVRLLKGAGPSHFFDRLVQVANTFGFNVAHHNLPDGVNGECRWASHVIAVEGRNEPLQQVKTLAHELGHVILHRFEANRAKAEIEAEAVAFVVLATHHADTSPYSASYLSSWIGETEDPVQAIRSSCDAIHHAATTILDRLDASCDPQQQQGASS